MVLIRSLFGHNFRKRIARPVDLSEVIDFKSILEEYNRNGELRDGVSVLNCDFDRTIFCLESRPGMLPFRFLNGFCVHLQCSY